MVIEIMVEGNMQMMNIDEEKESIMLVDDTPQNLKLLEILFRDSGYTVQSFSRGQEALAAAAKMPPHLILLDVCMPEMNGFEVCEHLKANPLLNTIPVIFMTALSQPEDKKRAFQCGGADYITKPFRLAEIKTRVKAQLCHKIPGNNPEFHNLQTAQHLSN